MCLWKHVRRLWNSLISSEYWTARRNYCMGVSQKTGIKSLTKIVLGIQKGPRKATPPQAAGSIPPLCPASRRGGKQRGGRGFRRGGKGLESGGAKEAAAAPPQQPPLTFPRPHGDGPQRGGGAGGGRSPQQPRCGSNERKQQHKGGSGRRAPPPHRHAAAHRPTSGRRRKAWAVAVATRGSAAPPLPWRRAGGVWEGFTLLLKFSFCYYYFFHFQKGNISYGVRCELSLEARPRPCYCRASTNTAPPWREALLSHKGPDQPRLLPAHVWRGWAARKGQIFPFRCDRRRGSICTRAVSAHGANGGVAQRQASS